MRVACYDRLLAHFLPGIGLISDLKQRGRRPSSSLEQRGVDHNINNILQLELIVNLSFFFKSSIKNNSNNLKKITFHNKIFKSLFAAGKSPVRVTGDRNAMLICSI